MSRSALLVLMLAVVSFGCVGSGYYNTATPGYGAYTTPAPPGGAYSGDGYQSPLPAPPMAQYHKSPVAAGVLGLVPGFGCGHFYAGDTQTGAVLLGLEAAGLAIGAWAIVRGFFEVLLVVITLGEYEPSDMEDIGDAAIAGMVIVGGCILYDVIHAPIVVGRRNRQAAGWSASVGPLGAVVRYDF